MRYLPLFLSSLFFTVCAYAEPKEFIASERVVYDKAFFQFVDKDTQLEVLASGFGWAEGPVWASSLQALLFSDLSVDKIYRWDEKQGLSEYVFPSGHAPDDKGSAWRGSNGLAIDQQGGLLLAQQGGRTLARMSAPLDKPAPVYEILASQFEGKLLNSPNDLLVHSSGDIYFTDPPYGLAGFEKSSAIELEFFGVFRRNKQGELSVVSRDLDKPNGLAFSNDYSLLYVSDSEKDKAKIIEIALDSKGDAKSSRLFFDAQHLTLEGPGSTDGMAMHSSGALFVSLPNGLGVLSAQGELLGRFKIGQVTNLAFDVSQSYLYVTTPTRLLRIKVQNTLI